MLLTAIVAYVGKPLDADSAVDWRPIHIWPVLHNDTYTLVSTNLALSGMLATIWLPEV